MNAPIRNHRLTYDADSEHEMYELEKKAEIRRSDGALRLRQLKPIHRTMVLMHLEGKSHREISAATKRSYVNVQLVLSDPLAKQMISRSMQASRQQLETLQVKAVDCVANALSSPSVETSLKGVDRYMALSDHLGLGAHQKETAEDVIQKILAQINVQVNIGDSGESSKDRMLVSTQIEGNANELDT